jgi:Ca-activated chloride channel homolog
VSAAFSISAWRSPWFLLVLLIPAAVWLWRRRNPQTEASVALGSAFLLESLPRGNRPWAWLAGLAHALGLACLALALARPVERVLLPPEQEGVEILLVIDRSSSMEARDLDPQRTRLQVAVDAAASFVDARTSDRIGLIAFARYPDLLTPTSLDHIAVQELLQGIEMVEPDGPEDLTGIGAAVARAAQVLKARMAQSKIVVLLTDGQENVATPAEPGSLQPLEAAALCRSWGVRVFPIAVAAEDPAALAELAQTTGGRAFAARDAGALQAVFASLDTLAKSPLAEPRFELHERFMSFVLLGSLLLLIARALRAGPAEVLA